jgi:catechol 2,3-dioxygenase-like lactoylglutathione lyase family enzyme
MVLCAGGKLSKSDTEELGESTSGVSPAAGGRERSGDDNAIPTTASDPSAITTLHTRCVPAQCAMRPTHESYPCARVQVGAKKEAAMNPDDLPAPKDGFVLTHFLVVSDQDRSRDFYESIFGGTVVIERDPVVMKVANSWLILNAGGGPTDDKPTVTLETPPDPNRTSAFLNVRVADIEKIYKEWSAKGAEFLTEPKDHGREIRAYVRDPDGHLIEVGQSTGILATE